MVPIYSGYSAKQSYRHGDFLSAGLHFFIHGVSQMRLNAFLAQAGMTSRRGADSLIKSGRVSVNGQTGQLNSQISDDDIVELDGQRISLQRKRYILLNKPTGYITTLKDEKGRRKVADLVQVAERIVPVGRLDYDTSGALLLTNDGELANRLMHPSFEFEKVYEAQVEGDITKDKLQKLERGVELEDGLSAPAKARHLGGQTIELTLHEGRNRQARRMLAAVGLPVLKLHRSKYGALTLNGLNGGQWRELSAEEVRYLIGLS
ncbi:MAG TPA: pseudouridine synthase [Candidatus Saccharimonadales bacterium]|nr:pseudouridine synthase [Candidatus Saccharimonadales bacterium]